MADNVDITPGTGATVSTEQVTTLNGATAPAQHIQRMLLAYRSADGIGIDLPADATYGLGVDVKRSALPTDAATQTTLAAVLAKLSADPATQTTLAAVLAKLSSDPATQTTLAAALVQLQAIAASVDGLEGYTDGVEGKLDTVHTDLTAIAGYVDGLEGFVDGLEGAFTTLNAKDFATQTTLAAVLAAVDGLEGQLGEVQASPTANTLLDRLKALKTSVDALHTDLTGTLTVGLPSGAATAAKQDTGNTSVASIDTKTPALASGRVPVDASGVAVPITDNSGSITVDGTFWQATQPVSGPLTDTQLRATAVPNDQTKLNGTTVDTNSGNKSAGTQRVVLATDQPALTTPLPVDTSRPATGTRTDVASSATSVTVLASNASRKGATIVNHSTQILYLKFGTTASATDFTVAIPGQVSGQIPSFYVLDAPCYTGKIDGLWASANGNARVTENT